MKQIILCDNGEYLKVSELCKKYNLSVNIDAFCNPEIIVTNPSEIDNHKKAYENINIYSIHGPFADLCFGSYDKLIKEATKNRFEYAYNIALQLGCNDIVLHHGYVPGTSHPPNWIKRGIDFWNEFLSDKQDDIKFHIENLLEIAPDLLLDIIDSVNDKRLDVCLDIGHVNCHSKISVLKWIEKLNTKIGFVHLHNNYGKKDEHLGFKKGTIDFLETCNALEQCAPNAIWGIESRVSDMDDWVSWLIDYGFVK